MKIRLFLVLLLFVFTKIADAQEPFYKGTKSLKATRIERAPEIDGIPGEQVWENLLVAENFFMVEPGNTPERETHPTRVKLAYDARQAIDFRFRNFWSAARFYQDALYKLQEDGDLTETSYRYTSENDPNANFNIWNLDLSYRWRFAPGSEAILLYRNSIFNLDNQSQLVYNESLEIF